jgi:hypothetical protein
VIITKFTEYYQKLISMTMTNKTFSRRLRTLIAQIEDHPHKDEIIKLAMEQMQEDDFEPSSYTS